MSKSEESPRDIEDRADCELLVRAFYARALVDPMIGWIFTDVARLDLAAHVPRITSFWETVLFGAHSYGGGAFAPHAALHARASLRAPHFQRWLVLWEMTVDELFAGERAELAKAHARRVAVAFHRRLQGMPEHRSAPASGRFGAITVTLHGGSQAAPRSGPVVVTRHGGLQAGSGAQAV